ncbi:radical SAM protein [Candidatus Margulisiibacteriota bacterium]
MKLYLRTKQFWRSLQYLAAIISKRKIFPFWAYITLTRKCNLNCPYCYVLDDSAPDLSIADTITAVNKLYQLGTRWISFTGGEPTLKRAELLAGIRQASLKKGIFTQLATNGTLLNQEYLAALGQAGLDLLDISLDSLAKHKSQKGLLDKNEKFSTEILAAQKKYGFILKSNFVLNKENINEVEELLEFCHKHMILLSLRMVFPSPGKSAVHRPQESGFFTKNDLPKIKKAVDLIIEKKKQGYLLTEPISYYLLWKKYLVESGQGRDLWECEAGEHCLGVDTDGMVRICNSLPAAEGRTDLHISKLDKKYYKLLQEQAKETKKYCQSKCLSAAYYCSQYYHRHPFSFLKDNFYKKQYFGK